jgi:hypothetical protein
MAGIGAVLAVKLAENERENGGESELYWPDSCKIG